VYCTEDPSSDPRARLHAQDPRSGHDLEVFAESDKPGLVTAPIPAPSQDTSEHSACLALRKLIDTAADADHSASNWAEFVAQCQDARGDLHPGVGDLPHRAAHLLDQLRCHGAPAGVKTEPWDDQRKRDALQRGSHQSALQHEGFLCEEFVELILKGQWVLLPADLVLQEPNLRIPLGVVSQQERLPRMICKFYFFLVNLDTIPLVPAKSMQFGCALWRILSTVHHADPRLGPIFLFKIDIADGFYHIWVNANGVPKLGVVVPTLPGQPKIIDFPLVLPMCWMQSPPLFTAATETVADLANQELRASKPAQPHMVDIVSESQGTVPELTPIALNVAPTLPLPVKALPKGRPSPPVKSWEVDVDDFIDIVQGSRTHHRHAKRVLLHNLDKVFFPLDHIDNKHRQEPASIKKMKKGDATWATRKIVLGWIINTVRLTIELPAHRLTRLFDLLHLIPPRQRRVSTKKWQQLVGELRSMVLAFAG
jgi:hypothetical protein